MRLRPWFLVGVVLGAALASSAVSAEPGAHIAWNDCVSFGQSFETFACNTNVGAHVAVGSFSAPFQIDQLIATEVTLRLYAPEPTLPLWWEVKGAGQCRNVAAFTSADFIAGPFNCFDFWQGAAAGGIASVDVGYFGPSTARIRLFHAVATAAPIAADVETYAYKLIINNSRTVGTGACTGCDHPIGIVVDNYKLVQPVGAPGGDVVLAYSGKFGSIGWQCPGKLSCGDGPGGTCNWFADCTTGAGRKAWGAIKSLYR